MIIEFIMNILKAFLLMIIGLFPKLPDMSGLLPALDPFVKALATVDYLVDIRVLSGCLVALFVFANLELIWGIIMWVIRKIPGVS